MESKIYLIEFKRKLVEYEIHGKKLFTRKPTIKTKTREETDEEFMSRISHKLKKFDADKIINIETVNIPTFERYSDYAGFIYSWTHQIRIWYRKNDVKSYLYKEK